MRGANLHLAGFSLCLLVACQLELGEGESESTAGVDAGMPSFPHPRPSEPDGSSAPSAPSVPGSPAAPSTAGPPSGGDPGAPDPTNPTTPEPPVPASSATNPEPTAPAPEPSAPGEDCTPDFACDPEPPDTGDPYADCVERINQFRACVCLPALERNHDAEACLDEQSEYDSSNGAHAGFSDRICEPNGNAQNECPGWGSERDVVEGCIRMMFYEGPPPEEPCEGRCYSEHGHFINMTSTRSTKVACGFFDADGEVWSVQNFYR